MWTDLLTGLVRASNPIVLLAVMGGTLLGIIIGALPGLGPVMGVALLMPFTYGLDPVVGISMLLGIYCGAIYGGSISAVLIGTPGTPASVVTVLDGYQCAKRGQGMKALQMALWASFVGGIFSAIVLTFLAPPLARLTLYLGPTEYFAMAALGLTAIASTSRGNILRGLLAGMLGMLLALVGSDPYTAASRYSFGLLQLGNGIPMVSYLLGLFAIPEILRQGSASGNDADEIADRLGPPLTFREFKSVGWWSYLRASIIGTWIGIVPGVGSTVASFMAYAAAKGSSKHPDEFGKGSLDGIAASETANNAVTGGALVPLLTFGVPGDVVTAVLIGAFMVQGLFPGLSLFKEHPQTVYGLFCALFYVNIAMLVLGLLCLRWFAKILRLPRQILYPVVGVLCIVGSYAINNRIFDIWFMLVFGLVGYALSSLRFPIPPLVIGYVLGGLFENSFRQASMLYGDRLLTVLVTRPATLVLMLISLYLIVSNLVSELRPRQGVPTRA